MLDNCPRGRPRGSCRGFGLFLSNRHLHWRVLEGEGGACACFFIGSHCWRLGEVDHCVGPNHHLPYQPLERAPGLREVVFKGLKVVEELITFLGRVGGWVSWLLVSIMLRLCA